MELPDSFLRAVFLLSRANELLRWRMVSRQWRRLITSRELFLARRRLRLPVDPLVLFHLDLFFNSPAGAVARYGQQDRLFPHRIVDRAPAEQQQPMQIVDAASTAAQLDRDTLFTILLLSRATDLVEWRRVCTEWRDIISSSLFICAYRDRQAPAPLLLISPSAAAGYYRKPLADPATTPKAISIIESVQACHGNTRSGPLLQLQVQGEQDFVAIHRSLDSILLLSYNKLLFAVNPITRRAVLLPPLHRGRSTIVALYRGPHHNDHNPDYCILYCRHRRPIRSYSCFSSFSITRKESSVLTWQAESVEVENALSNCMPDLLHSTLFFNGLIYWIQGRSNMILCFDPNLTLFSLLPTPIVGARCRQVMEIHGLLGVTTIESNEPTMGVWVKEAEWHQLYRVKISVNQIQQVYGMGFQAYGYYVASADGDVLVDLHAVLLHFDCNGSLLGLYSHQEWNIAVVPHMLKGNLLPIVPML